MRYSVAAAAALLLVGLPSALAAPQAAVDAPAPPAAAPAPAAPAPAAVPVQQGTTVDDKSAQQGTPAGDKPAQLEPLVPTAPGPVIVPGLDAPVLVDAIKTTQMQDASAPGGNITGSLTSIIDGTLMAVSPERLQGSTGVSWNKTSVSGSWSFNTQDTGSFSGGWTTDGKTYEHNGGVALNNGSITLDTKVIVHTNGSIDINIDAGYLLRCETTPDKPDMVGTTSSSKTRCHAYAPNGMPSRRAEQLLPRATPMLRA